MFSGSKNSRLKNSVFIRNLVFGVEDGLVSTVGFISGVAMAGMEKPQLILSGLVLIFVEAFSMGVGSFLSESSTEEYEAEREVKSMRPFIGGLVMFFSYLIAGFLIIFPYFLLSGVEAIHVSVVLAALALLFLGFYSAKISKISPLKRSFKMMMFGGLAIGIGVLVGKLVDFLPIV